MQKFRYELDPYNRVIVEQPGKSSDLPLSRRVLDGRFRLDPNNNLSYHIKSPFAGKDTIPNQLRLRGKWSLTKEHDLKLTLDKSARRTFGDKLTLQGQVIDVRANSLLFAVTTKSKEGVRSTYVINFSGVWNADEHNRLSFRIKKERGKYDILTFNAAWQINRHHQVVYKYEKARLLRKKRINRILTFKGCWDVQDKFRISYLLDGSAESKFTFRTAAGIFADKYIKYEAAIRLARRLRPVRRIIHLSGRWKLNKDFSLVFEVEYENGRKRYAAVSTDAKLTARDKLRVKIKFGKGVKDISANIKFSHVIISGKGEAFLRAVASRRKSAIYAGAACRW